MKLSVKLSSLFVVLMFGSLLSSCGGSCGPGSLQPLNVDLQLDYVGTVPVLNGGATHSYFYVHNDGDSQISGINYTLAGAGVGNDSIGKRLNSFLNKSHKSGELNASGDIVDGNGFTLLGSSLSNCAMIESHSACKIEFVTPALSAGNQNNSLFKVSVKDGNGFTHNFDQVINYVDYNVGLNNGVNFATSADVVANLTDKRYMMGYLVAGGVAGQIYNNVTLSLSNNNSVSINDGFIEGTQMSSGELIPIEFNVNILSELPSPENITPQYVIVPVPEQNLKNVMGSGQSLYLNTSSQTQSELALKLGLIPILASPTSEANAPTIYVSNFGESINGFTIEPSDSNITLYQNTCTSYIGAYGSCSFKLGTNSLSSGSSDVLFKVNGKTIFTKAVYYTNPSSASLIGNVPGIIGLIPNQSSVISIPFSNLSDGDLTNLNFNPIISGASGFEIVSNTCSPTLVAGAQCLMQVRLIGSVSAESGTAYLGVTGDYAGNGFTSQSNIINYYVVGNAGQLVITSPIGSESSLSIIGNGRESATAVFTINNPGSDNQAISSISLTGLNVASSGLAITGNTCGNSLAANASCQVTVKYGPLTPESNNSGVANLQIKYGTKVMLGTINYSVVALDSHLQITNVVAGSGFSGAGTLNVPYAGSGCNNNPLTLTLTYKNMSQNFAAQNLSLSLINDDVSPYYTVDPSSTCGYGSSPKNLGIGQSCNLVLVANRSNMKYNNSFNLDVIYPSASWNTTQGFIEQSGFTYNGTTRVYANYSQPVLTSSITPESSSSLTRTLTQTLTGANVAGCGDFITNTGSFAYESSAVIMSGNCIHTSDGISCTNNSSATTNTIVYTISDDVLPNTDLFMMFSLTPNGNHIWYNPSILMFTVLGGE